MLNPFQYLADWLTLRLRPPDRMRQVAALPYALVDGRVTFLLVTSRRTGRWIYPKGSMIEGRTAAESAAQEAYEEAGVEGVIAEEPIGTYRTIKKGGLARHVVEVDLYPLLVTRQLDSWPEMDRRHRHWVAIREARRLLNDPMLNELTAKLNRQLVGTPQRGMARMRK